MIPDTMLQMHHKWMSSNANRTSLGLYEHSASKASQFWFFPHFDVYICLKQIKL